MWKGKLVLWFTMLCFGLSCISKNSEVVGGDQGFSAEVIRIIDGDTMEVLFKERRIKIRLAHIDCPEIRSGQPFNKESKKALSDLCFVQVVRISGRQFDRYQRLIAVIVNQKHQIVNQEMVKRGMAWHFKKYSNDANYAKLEIEARKQRVGIWSDPNPTPPWLWRKPKKD